MNDRDAYSAIRRRLFQRTHAYATPPRSHPHLAGAQSATTMNRAEASAATLRKISTTSRRCTEARRLAGSQRSLPFSADLCRFLASRFPGGSWWPRAVSLPVTSRLYRYRDQYGFKQAHTMGPEYGLFD
jgi:hypothetical protein